MWNYVLMLTMCTTSYITCIQAELLAASTQSSLLTKDTTVLPDAGKNQTLPGKNVTNNSTDKKVTPVKHYSPYIAIYETCYSHKGCFGFREGCVEEESCGMLLTYSVSEDGTFFFELMGSSDGYLAMALSTDENMGNDGGVMCYRHNDEIEVSKIWNFGPPLYKKHTSILKETHDLKDVHWLYEDGWILCGFSITNIMTVHNITFSIMNDSYYLMTARGPISNSGNPIYHGIYRSVVAEPIFLSHSKEVQSLTSPLVKYHGAFMITAWIGTGSTGILFSRYMRNSWLHYRIFTKPLWFVVHQTCMVATCLFTITALSIIFAQLNGWTTVPLNINPHAALGCGVAALLLLQMLIASTRVKWKRRNWTFLLSVHWVVGHLTHVLAIITCFFGIRLGKAALPESIHMILSSYVVVHCLAHTLLTTQKVIQYLRECRSEGTAVHISTISSTDDEDSNTWYSRLESMKPEEPNPGIIFHQVVVSTYLIVVWILTLILVVVIAAPENA